MSSLFDNSKNFQKLFQVVFSYLQIIVDSRNNEGIYSGQEAHSLTFEYIYLLYINYDVLISMYLNLHQKCVDICFMHLPYRPHGHLCCRTAYLYLGGYTTNYNASHWWCLKNIWDFRVCLVVDFLVLQGIISSGSSDGITKVDYGLVGAF